MVHVLNYLVGYKHGLSVVSASLASGNVLERQNWGPFFGSAIRNARQTSRISLGEAVTDGASSRGQGNVDKGMAHFFHVTRYVMTPVHKNLNIIATRLLIKKLKLNSRSAIRRHAKSGRNWYAVLTSPVGTVHKGYVSHPG